MEIKTNKKILFTIFFNFLVYEIIYERFQSKFILLLMVLLLTSNNYFPYNVYIFFNATGRANFQEIYKNWISN